MRRRREIDASCSLRGTCGSGRGRDTYRSRGGSRRLHHRSRAQSHRAPGRCHGPRRDASHHGCNLHAGWKVSDGLYSVCDSRAVPDVRRGHILVADTAHCHRHTRRKARVLDLGQPFAFSSQGSSGAWRVAGRVQKLDGRIFQKQEII